MNRDSYSSIVSRPPCPTPHRMAEPDTVMADSANPGETTPTQTPQLSTVPLSNVRGDVNSQGGDGQQGSAFHLDPPIQPRSPRMQTVPTNQDYGYAQYQQHAYTRDPQVQDSWGNPYLEPSVPSQAPQSVAGQSRPHPQFPHPQNAAHPTEHPTQYVPGHPNHHQTQFPVQNQQSGHYSSHYSPQNSAQYSYQPATEPRARSYSDFQFASQHSNTQHHRQHPSIQQPTQYPTLQSDQDSTHPSYQHFVQHQPYPPSRSLPQSSQPPSQARGISQRPSNANSSRPPSVAPSQEEHFSTDGDTSDSLSNASHASRSTTGNKKRRHNPGPVERETQTMPNLVPSSVTHHVPSDMQYQQLMTELRGVRDRLDHYSSSTAQGQSMPQPQPLVPFDPSQIATMIADGFKVAHDILRQGVTAEVKREPADEDMDEDELKPKQKKLSKSALEPQTRAPRSRKLARVIRDAFKSLFKGDVNKTTSNETPPCTIEDFRLDLSLPPSGAHNVSAKKLFVAYVFNRNDPIILQIQPTKEEVSRLFISNFRNARTKDKRRKLTQDENDALKQQHRRRERRRWMYYRRVKAAKRYADTKRHLRLVMAFGIDGMSSDESDHNNATGQTLYRIHVNQWRHPDATECLRALDSVHRDSRFGPKRTATSGAHAHNRVITSTQSKRPPVRELPSNLYSAKWVSKLPEFAYKELEIEEVPQGERYDFSHTPYIRDLVWAKNNGQLNANYIYA